MKFQFRQRLGSVLVCLCSFSLAQAAGPAPAASVTPAIPAHPLVGTWSWPVFGGQCVETLQYRGSGSLLSTSGEAVTEWSYKTTPQASEKGFFKVVETSVRQNGKKDCSGDSIDQDGEIAIRYIQLSPNGKRLIVCKTEALSACFGPLDRIE
jgi:hypothetical protein